MYIHRHMSTCDVVYVYDIVGDIPYTSSLRRLLSTSLVAGGDSLLCKLPESNGKEHNQ